MELPFVHVHMLSPCAWHCFSLVWSWHLCTPTHITAIDNSFPKNHLEDIPKLFCPPEKVEISQTTTQLC
ncbi:hypothetical protein HRbin36_02809 [bacterium HR36]|nr:hypothetical protein HRbin36_02809 [bacterium HR36]